MWKKKKIRYTSATNDFITIIYLDTDLCQLLDFYGHVQRPSVSNNTKKSCAI